MTGQAPFPACAGAATSSTGERGAGSPRTQATPAGTPACGARRLPALCGAQQAAAEWAEQAPSKPPLPPASCRRSALPHALTPAPAPPVPQALPGQLRALLPRQGLPRVQGAALREAGHRRRGGGVQERLRHHVRTHARSAASKQAGKQAAFGLLAETGRRPDVALLGPQLRCMHTLHMLCVVHAAGDGGAPPAGVAVGVLARRSSVPCPPLTGPDRPGRRIQAAWRGHRAQRRFQQLWLERRPQQPQLRLKWCAAGPAPGGQRAAGSSAPLCCAALRCSRRHKRLGRQPCAGAPITPPPRAGPTPCCCHCRRRCAARLQRGSTALLQQVEQRAGDIDALFAELDASLAVTRQVREWALQAAAGGAAATAAATAGPAAQYRRRSGAGALAC
jgi:hypothetical protein